MVEHGARVLKQAWHSMVFKCLKCASNVILQHIRLTQNRHYIQAVKYFFGFKTYEKPITAIRHIYARILVVYLLPRNKYGKEACHI